jgi:hypothetical protein
VVTARGSQARDRGFNPRWELQKFVLSNKYKLMLAKMANAEGHKKKIPQGKFSPENCGRLAKPRIMGEGSN